MHYSPPRRRSPVPLVLALVALVLAVAVAVVLAAVLLTREDGTAATKTAHRMTAPQIVAELERRGVVEAGACAPEKGSPPATSQSRCDLGDGAELIAMGFADGAGVRERLGGWLGEGTLVQGPNWLVNVGDLDGDYREQVRTALGGELVTVQG